MFPLIILQEKDIKIIPHAEKIHMRNTLYIFIWNIELAKILF